MNDPFQLAQRLQQRHEKHLYRRRRVLESAQQSHIVCDGAEVLNFCSNDYLGLAAHPALIKAVSTAANQYGVGSGASHLVIGHSALHHQLEERLADWVGRPRALLFSTGYMANLGAISALLQKGDTIVQDKLNHASLMDGAQLSRARLLRYQHCDLEGLEQRLQGAQGSSLVVTDSVFSMDGDIAPLSEMAALCNRYSAWLMVDDAHGIGVLGDGRGCLAEYQLALDEVPVYVGTLGKALGTYGAFVAGGEELIEYLIQAARPYIYTTAMPPLVAAATLASLDLLQRESWRIEKLRQLISCFRAGAAERGLPIMRSDTAIQPLLVHQSAKAVCISESLLAQGFLVSAIRPPTVPENSARLRVTLNATHSEQDLERLLDALIQALQSFQ